MVNEYEYEEDFIKSLHRATKENRISWDFVSNDENLDERKYQTLINDQKIEISFLGVNIVSETPLNENMNTICYSIVIISGFKLWIEASSGTVIFELAKKMVSKNSDNSDIKYKNRIKSVIDLINQHNIKNA